MSRMHKEAHGSSGSSKPVEKDNPDWVEFEEDEIIEIILELREEGLQPAQIGLRLRDEYGVPSVKQATGKKLTEILEEEDAAPEMPEDLKNLVEKAESIQSHLDENPSDEQAQRQLELAKAKVRKVADYHREEGNIPEDWEYAADE
ncbi:30S ribosomal protein S15 [Candidatus Nanohalobium constans]|uniref:Small ribosomal subunit protein uS15 n=1 Tax=Candidatus Nanohalobium constans TaxID=2565781 RepID=A0A5Q0UID8_9ARCH|nr:30S ribosomal protein S15 [Candidatus Nanohalobium constans]QGA80649.1 30S ribosomal protein S15 [Candidatus Nanohalobium constans]